MSTKVIATATVRAVTRKLMPSRAAITLVRKICKNPEYSIITIDLYLDTISCKESQGTT